MAWTRDIMGGTLSALATLALFTGAPVLGLLGGAPALAQEIEFRPMDSGPLVWLEAAEEPPVVEAEAELPLAAPVVADAAPRSSVPPAPREVVASGAVRADYEPTSREPAAAEPRRKGCDPDPIAEIVSMGSKAWTIERGLIKTYTGNLGRLNSLGYSSQHDGPDGRPDGMRIGGVRCNNDLHRAGLRTGDVIHTVNGHAVKNIPGALVTYLKVKNDPVIRVELTRRGERVIHTYSLVG